VIRCGKGIRFEAAMAIAITRTDYTAAELRRQAANCHDGDAARRMLALALVLDGRSRGEAAKLCGMERQTLRDWVHRYEAEGLAGLFDRPRPGRPAGLTAEQEAELARIVEAGPELAKHGVVRWRGVDLQTVIAEKFGGQPARAQRGSAAAQAQVPPPFATATAPGS
jgi:transposase